MEKKANWCDFTAYWVTIAFLAILGTSLFALFRVFSSFSAVALPVVVGLLAIGIPAGLAVEAHMKKKHLLAIREIENCIF